MNERLLEVRQRRGELLRIIAAQRETIANSATRWQYPLAVLDRGCSVAGHLRRHPVMVAAVAALLVARRNSLAGALKWGLVVWRGYRYLDAMKYKLTVRKATIQRL